MAVVRARLNKETLENIPSRERSLFSILAHLANEIRALEKLILWSGHSRSESDVEIGGQCHCYLCFSNSLPES